jgi:hypothetical protein
MLLILLRKIDVTGIWSVATTEDEKHADRSPPIRKLARNKALPKKAILPIND